MGNIEGLKEKGYLNDKLPNYFRKIVNSAFKKDRNMNAINEDDIYHKAEELITEYLKKGYISNYIFKELLTLPDSIWALFYTYLYTNKQLGGKRPEHKAKVEKNTKWLVETDYCFMNIRALGEEISETGNIINAVKLLPALRVGGIHLAPFFECNHGIIYCQDSFYRINREIINLYYEKEGVTPLEQMKFFIDCIHLLDKAVGFDVTPHTSHMSKLSLDRPELFRWIRLNNEKDGLYDGMHINEQYQHTYQEKCNEHIDEIANKIKREYGITKVDDIDCDHEKSDDVADLIRKEVMKEGYYTVPPHTWNGICVPSFKKFDYIKEEPIWDYRDINGQDQGHHAIWMHACLYIHKGMHANQLPSQVTNNEEDGFVEKNTLVIDFFKKYLKEIIETYEFDYIRMDYVDHIFDNVRYVNGEEVPINEMLTPNEILQIISELRKEYKGLGLQADHLGDDAMIYEKAGFNLVIGGEVAVNMSRFIMEESIKCILKGKKIQRELCRSLYAIDTHDVAHPLYRGKELANREGKIGVIGRLFISRFANVGIYRKPKYEVIGDQDLSHGIHRANNKPESLIWASNRETYQAYHDLEDLYSKLGEKLSNSVLEGYGLLEKHLYFEVKNIEHNVKWICIMPIIYIDGFPCDSEFVKEHENEELKDSFFHNICNSNYKSDLKLLACTSVENLNFREVKKNDVIEVKKLTEKLLKIKMKTRGFAMLEIKYKKLGEKHDKS